MAFLQSQRVYFSPMFSLRLNRGFAVLSRYSVDLNTLGIEIEDKLWSTFSIGPC